MKKEDILKYNPLIAKFMGYEYEIGEGTQPRGWYKLIKCTLISDSTHREYLCRNDLEIKYHKNWNWLKKVIDRISDIASDEPNSELYTEAGKILSTHICCDIETVYSKTINFIEWYNLKNK